MLIFLFVCFAKEKEIQRKMCARVCVCFFKLLQSNRVKRWMKAHEKQCNFMSTNALFG